MSKTSRFTMTRIEIEDNERLRQWAKINRRSMTQQLGMFVPALPTSYNPKSPSEVLADMKPTDPVVKAFEGDNDYYESEPQFINPKNRKPLPKKGSK